MTDHQNSSAESCVLRWARPMGATFDSMRKHVWETGLADIGDTILIWVNEGDFWEAMIRGVQLKEYKNPDGGGSAAGVPAEMQGSNDRGLAQDAEKPEDTTQGDRPARPVTCSSSGVMNGAAQSAQVSDLAAMEQFLSGYFWTGEPGEHDAIKAAARDLVAASQPSPAATAETIPDDVRATEDMTLAHNARQVAINESMARPSSSAGNGVALCPGCDGHECDNGCRYPGARDLIERLHNPAWAHGNIPFESPQLDREENLAAMNEAAAMIGRLIRTLPQASADTGRQRAIELLIKLQTIGNAEVYRLASEAQQMLELPISVSPQHVQVTEGMLAAGAQALADDVWHPPQKFSSLPQHDQNKFTRQSLLVLKAASSQLTRPEQS